MASHFKAPLLPDEDDPPSALSQLWQGPPSIAHHPIPIVSALLPVRLYCSCTQPIGLAGGTGLYLRGR